MKIAVGSKRKAKINAVKKAFSLYYNDIDIFGVDVDSKISKQPMTDEETIHGAINRATGALKYGDIGVGIEAGLKKVPQTITGYLNTTWCAIADKDGRITIGSSPDFEFPPKVIEGILEGKEATEAAIGVFKRKDIELREYGIIGELTKGIMKRDDYTYYAVLMALLPRINEGLYG